MIEDELICLDLFSLGLTILCMPFLFFMSRLVVKMYLGRFWNFWYVRRASEVAIVGILLTLIGSFVFGSHVTKDLDTARNVQAGKAMEAFMYSNIALDGYCKLKDLSRLNWFLEHIGPLAVLPSSLIFFIGATINRNNNASLKNQG